MKIASNIRLVQDRLRLLNEDGRSMSKYRKKPIVIEAIQFTGNDKEIIDFCPSARDPEDLRPNLIIPTLEGDMLLSFGDWVIIGVKGEFYPCKPDIFEVTYEKID